jgi:SPASM domain peptide maturase of grasp-with-spasm system
MRTGSESIGQVLKLFPNVIPVKGYNRSLLMDLQSGQPYLVPNDLLDYLEQGSEEEIIEYRTFITDNELGILMDADLAAGLTPLPLNHYPVSKISNAILELDEHSSWDLSLVLNQLDELGTQFIEIRFLDYRSVVSRWKTIQQATEGTTIESIQVFLPFSKELKKFLDEHLKERFFRLGMIVVYNAPSGFELESRFYNLLFTSQESVSHENCGTVSMESFVINTQGYTRNRNYNSCLAHKVSVDKNGSICNCPSLNQTYGQVGATALQEVVARKAFQSQWELTKDQVPICSVCEFRWICTDCRAFTTAGIENGKPSKCTYNPFISLWADEENYLPEEACGISFQGNQVLVNEEQLNQINAGIWE